jgi:4-amino-4-deoxy-L-arabinose transferase-like glycosyltransferase
MPVPPDPFLRAAVARLLLSLGALALFLPGFFSLPPTDRDESRFAQASRQMLEDGDYLHIRFQEQARLNKPAGIYWLQAAAARLAGAGWDNPVWPYRLPSLLGALAAVALTARLGERMGAPGTGWRAGALLALTVLLGVEARLAKTDAVLLALVVAAQAALWVIYQARRAGRAAPWPAVQGFWMAQAAALLVKGPIALLVSVLTVLTLALADRDARLWRALRPGWGALWFAVLVLPWLWAIHRASDGAFWHDAVARDLLAKAARGQESHGAPPGTHLLLTPLTLWPAVLLLAPGLAACWRARAEPAARFLLAWALPCWLLFELIPTKLPHYILPTVPALCLMAGVLLGGPQAAAPAWSRWLGRALWALGALLLSGLTVWLPRAAGEPVGGFALAAGMMVAGAAVLLALGRRGPALGLAGLLPAGLVLGLMLPRLDALWPSREVARQLRAQGVTAPLIAAGYTEPSLVFWTGRATTLLSDGDAAAGRLLREPGRPVLVDERREAAFLAALAAAGAGAEPLARIAARDLNGGAPLRLTLYRLAGAAR